MTKDEKIVQLQKKLAETRKRLDAEIKTGLIKAFEMKPGHKYVIFFGRDSGLHPEDIANINDPLFAGTLFVLNDVSKVDVMDKEKILKHFQE